MGRVGLAGLVNLLRPSCLLMQVYGLPALILFKGGKMVVKREGAISKKLIQDWLTANGIAPATA